MATIEKGTDMITTEYVADGVLLIHAKGRVDKNLVKEVALLVFRSFHLGVTTFFLKVHQRTPLHEEGFSGLDLIGQGVRNKGGAWRMLGSPSSVWDQLMFRITLQQLPPATWN